MAVISEQVRDIQVELEKTAWNSRKLFASVSIQAPVKTVWACLTDYDGLADFIPSLVENKCLERRANGALIRQVGNLYPSFSMYEHPHLGAHTHYLAMQVGAVQMGVRFSATCTLECCEFEEGLPDGFCSTSGDGSDGLLPHPRQGLPDAPKKDITFVLVEGDFQVGLPSGGQTFPCPNWVTGM